jgi:hypothetical protein
MREGERAKARSKLLAEMVDRARMWRVARRVVWERVYAAGLADGRVRREGRDCVESV